MKIYVLLGLTFLILSAAGQTTNSTNSTNSTNTTTTTADISCTKGDDKPCTDISPSWCCAYSKGLGIESHSCSDPAIFETAKSVANAAGIDDFEVYCDNAVFAKISVAILALFAFAQLL